MAHFCLNFCSVADADLGSGAFCVKKVVNMREGRTHEGRTHEGGTHQARTS